MYTITIDGPSASGKSTVAKLVAKKLNFYHLNSGNIYRAITLFLLEKGLSPNEQITEDILSQINVEIKFENNLQVDYLNGKNVTTLLHSHEINDNVSRFGKQELIIKKASKLTLLPTLNYNIVIDGRNVGSFVLPNAFLKIYLDCDAKVRAERRFKEMLEKGEKVDFDEIYQQTLDRDELDRTRPIAPMIVPENAVIINSSNKTPEEVAIEIVDIFNSKI